MKLYGNAISTCTRKVLTTLAEKGAEAELVSVDLFKGEQKSPAHLAHQPFGRVPAIDDDGFALYESRAILRYLDDKLPGVKLTPSDAKQRAYMEQWTSVEYSYFSPTALKVIRETYFHPMLGVPTDHTVAAAAKKELEPILDVLDKQLAKTPYLAGETFTLADIGYMPYVDYLFAGKDAALVESRVHMAAWWKRVSTRASWQKVAGKA